ncbi:MAG: hypothetical protein SGPRY_003086, partial [Prymnesium sp.]
DALSLSRLGGSFRPTWPSSSIVIAMDFAVVDAQGNGPANPALVAQRGPDPLIEIPAQLFFRRVRGLHLFPSPGA